MVVASTSCLGLRVSVAHEGIVECAAGPAARAAKRSAGLGALSVKLRGGSSPAGGGGLRRLVRAAHVASGSHTRACR